jgi:uncharacterized protein (TIGR00255 family)
MKSMTGYGEQGAERRPLLLVRRVKGYNNRFLRSSSPSSVPFPARDEAPGLRRGKCERGKIELSVRARILGGNLTVSVDEAAAAAYFQAIKALAASLGLDEQPRLSTILGMEGVLLTDKTRDPERLWLAIEPALAEALAQFESSRAREGRATEADILSHLASIEKAVETVAGHLPELENSIKENLRTRFRDVLGDAVDENRVLAETAVLLMKYTISEELARLRAHLDEFRSESPGIRRPARNWIPLSGDQSGDQHIGSKSPIRRLAARSSR